MSNLPYVFGSEPVKDSTQLNANFDALNNAITSLNGIKNIYYKSSNSVSESNNDTEITLLSSTFTPPAQLYHFILAKYYKLSVYTEGLTGISTNGMLYDGATLLDSAAAGILSNSAIHQSSYHEISLFWYGQLSSAEHTITLKDFASSDYALNAAYHTKLLIIQFSF